LFVQINLFGFFSFFLLLYAGMALCNLIQSAIRSMICAVFLYRFLVQQDKPQLAKVTFFVYLVLLLGFEAFLSVDIFINDDLDCTPDKDWQVTTLVIVDTIQTALLITVALVMYCQTTQRRDSQSVLMSSGRSNDAKSP